jgi:hypothetical protein
MRMMFPNPPTQQSDAQQLLAALTSRSQREKIGRLEDRHSERRATLSMGILVVPLNDESPEIGKAFTAMTKDVGAGSIGVVANRSIATSEALLRLSGDSETRLLRTTIRNRKDLGQGWVRFDMDVTGVLDKSEYPQLKHFVGSIMS